MIWIIEIDCKRHPFHWLNLMNARALVATRRILVVFGHSFSLIFLRCERNLEKYGDDRKKWDEQRTRRLFIYFFIRCHWWCCCCCKKVVARFSLYRFALFLLWIADETWLRRIWKKIKCSATRFEEQGSRICWMLCVCGWVKFVSCAVAYCAN